MLGLITSPARLAFSAGIVAVSVAGVAGLTSTALFSDSTDVTGNTFQTGTLALNTTDLTSGTWTNSISAMAIGSTSMRPITVTNSGSIAGVFTVTEAGGNTSDAALGTALQADLTEDDCTGTAGTSLYSGSLSSLAVSTGVSLAATASQDLCLRISLPTTGTNAGDNALQDTSYDSTLTFTLTQAS